MGKEPLPAERKEASPEAVGLTLGFLSVGFCLISDSGFGEAPHFYTTMQNQGVQSDNFAQPPLIKSTASKQMEKEQEGTGRMVEATTTTKPLLSLAKDLSYSCLSSPPKIIIFLGGKEKKAG